MVMDSACMLHTEIIHVHISHGNIIYLHVLVILKVYTAILVVNIYIINIICLLNLM